MEAWTSLLESGVLTDIVALLDNANLEKLASTSLWPVISASISSGTLFWYKRTETLVGKYLIPRLEADWRDIYTSLSCATEDDQFPDEVLSSTAAVLVQLELGCIPLAEDLKDSCERNYIGAVRALLADGRADPRAGYCLDVPCDNGYEEIVEMLLCDGRVDPAQDDGYCFIVARTENVIRMLLEDGRVDPRVRDNIIFYDACSEGNYALVKMLLKDGRVDPTSDNRRAMGIACDNRRWNILALLESDPRTRALVDKQAQAMTSR